MKIKNFNELATTDGRRALLTIAEFGLDAIDTTKAMRKLLRVGEDHLYVGKDVIDLERTNKIVFIAIGKCAAEAATVADEILGNKVTRGVVVDVKPCPALEKKKHWKTFYGTHPLPSSSNLDAARAVVESLNGLTEFDVVIFVVSGGGSTLLFLPENEANREETAIFNALTAAGATIQEMNTVRKHMSRARGGWLAKYAYPAKVVSLIFSDVPGDDISSVASGPTVRDMTTMEDAAEVLAKYDVLNVCPIENCGLMETPKEKKYFDRVTNILAVSNEYALDAMKWKAQQLGFRTAIRSTALEGEAADVARMVERELHDTPAGSVLLWGGETTVTVHGPGNGGRNLTLSATALEDIRSNEEILSLASDGRDHGLWAGALCDTITKKAADTAKIDIQKFLITNDTYPLFKKIGNYLVTGDTGSNVSDLIIALKM